jgi:hypothetical protein
VDLILFASPPAVNGRTKMQYDATITSARQAAACSAPILYCGSIRTTAAGSFIMNSGQATAAPFFTASLFSTTTQRVEARL